MLITISLKMATEEKELTIFEKIANKTIPSTMVYEDDKVYTRFTY